VKNCICGAKLKVGKENFKRSFE